GFAFAMAVVLGLMARRHAGRRGAGVLAGTSAVFAALCGVLALVAAAHAGPARPIVAEDDGDAAVARASRWLAPGPGEDTSVAPPWAAVARPGIDWSAPGAGAAGRGGGPLDPG